MPAHSYGKGTSDQPDVRILAQAQDPAGRRELLGQLGYGGQLAEHEFRTATAADRFPKLEEPLYRRYFERTLEPASDEHHAALSHMLAEIETANVVAEGEPKRFDRFIILATASGDAYLALGVVETELDDGRTRADEFLIAQWPDEPLVTPDSMRKQFGHLDRAAARRSWRKRLRGTVRGFIVRHRFALSGISLLAAGILVPMVMGFWPAAIVIGVLGFIVAVAAGATWSNPKDGTIGVISGSLAAVLMAIYGLSHIHAKHHVPVTSTQKILVCDVVKPDRTNRYAATWYATVATGDNQTYEVVPGEYSVTTGPAVNGAFPHKQVFESDSIVTATDVFQLGHTYMVTLKTYSGDQVYTGIIGAYEVPNDMGVCGQPGKR